MSTYAIGDLQGCLGAFDCLLEKIRFQPGEDRLLLAGDLVARGPDSLGTLRRVYGLREHLDCVLGNHDLHLLALAHGHGPKKNKDADLRTIIDAPDAAELLGWLQQQPLLHLEPDFNAVLVHAGLPPIWGLSQAAALAAEVETVLRSGDADSFFAHMYGNTPSGWDDQLTGTDRLRVITNYFTRMRFVDAAGQLELSSKGEADTAPPGFTPWFEHPGHGQQDTLVLFGHWAALGGSLRSATLEALDSGCVWGGQLTALRLEDRQRFYCDCQHSR